MAIVSRTEIYNVGDLRRALEGFDDQMEVSVHASIHKYVEIWTGTSGSFYCSVQGSDVEQTTTHG